MTSSRYLAGQRLSDYQIEKMIEAYSERLIGSKTLRVMSSRPTRAPNTVFKLFGLLRRRLTELRYFPDPIDYFKWLNGSEASLTFLASGTARELTRLVSRLDGSTDETGHEHVAEILFLAENPDYRASDFYRDIQLAVKITGPLNRPPQNLDIWYEKLAIMMYRRHIQKMMATMAVDPEYHRRSIDRYRVMIKLAEQKIETMMRKRRAQTPKRKSRVTASRNARQAD